MVGGLVSQGKVLKVKMPHVGTIPFLPQRVAEVVSSLLIFVTVPGVGFRVRLHISFSCLFWCLGFFFPPSFLLCVRVPELISAFLSAGIFLSVAVNSAVPVREREFWSFLCCHLFFFFNWLFMSWTYYYFSTSVSFRLFYIMTESRKWVFTLLYDIFSWKVP